MDLGKTINSIGNSLQKAKRLGNNLAQKKAAETKPSKSGTGVYSPGSFGVNVDTQPATMRMAGGVGLQQLASTVIHTGINKYAMPQIDKFMTNIATDIKKGAAKGVSKKTKAGY